MTIPHDIRLFVPQINPELLNRFPRVHQKPYPRMMTKEENGKKVPYKHSNGRPVIVADAEEEQKFLEAQLGSVAKAAQTLSVAVETAQSVASSVAEAPAYIDVSTEPEQPRVKRKYTRRTLEP